MAEEQAQANVADKKIFTTGEAAALCKVSQQTIIRCFDSGRLGGFRVPGSRFRRIPRAELIKFMRNNGISPEALESSAKRVLVVDDDPAILSMFKEIFERDGRFTCRTASNGYDAGLLTATLRPDLIILDVMLPDINGNVVCQRIKEREELRGTKIIFVSGVVGADELARLSAAGADGFLRKPFDVSELLNKVSELLEV